MAQNIYIKINKPDGFSTLTPSELNYLNKLLGEQAEKDIFDCA